MCLPLTEYSLAASIPHVFSLGSTNAAESPQCLDPCQSWAPGSSLAEEVAGKLSGAAGIDCVDAADAQGYLVAPAGASAVPPAYGGAAHQRHRHMRCTTAGGFIAPDNSAQGGRVGWGEWC